MKAEKINDDIYKYEVIEAFISKGSQDPQTYLEFEVNPNNVTFQAFIYNPSREVSDGAPFNNFFINDSITGGLTAVTKLQQADNFWVSNAQIPLALFNIGKGQVKGTSWRMDFLEH